jgi:hypothetical protein
MCCNMLMTLYSVYKMKWNLCRIWKYCYAYLREWRA